MSKVYSVKVSGEITTKMSTNSSEESSLEYLPIHLNFVCDEGLGIKFLQESSTCLIKDEGKIAVLPTSQEFTESSLDFCAFKVYGQDAYSGSIGIQITQNGVDYVSADITNIESDDANLFYYWGEGQGKYIILVTLEGEPRELSGTVYVRYGLA